MAARPGADIAAVGLREVEVDLTDGAARTMAVNQRLVGLVAAATRIDFAEPDWIEELDDSWQAEALGMERLLVAVVGALTEAGIDSRLIKGPALAHTVYPEASWRTFADLDIVVRGEQLGEARRLLTETFQAQDPLPEVRPGFDAEFAKDVMLRIDRTEIDLHRTVAPGPFGMRVPTDELFDSPTEFALAGTTLRTLSPTATFVQVCYNAALGDVPPRLMSLRDVAQVQHHHQLAVDDIVKLADRWGGTAVVASAVTQAWETLELDPTELSTWAASYEPSWLDAKLLAASVSQQRSYTRALASVAAIKGPRAKARYLRSVLSPSAEYLEARNWTRGSHVRRAIDRLKPRR